MREGVCAFLGVKRGDMMKSFFRIILFIAMIGLASCAIFPKGIFSSGQVKLLNLSVPGTMHENLPYDVVVTFRAEGGAKIRKACFRWIDETSLVNQTSLYCYAATVDEGLSACRRWMADGQYSHASPTFCADIKEITYDETPARFTVRLSSHNVKENYNKLECYAEYVIDGTLKNSNRVSSKIPVQE